MKFKKKAIVLSCLLTLALAVSTVMAAVVSDDIAHQYSKDGKYYIQAYFNPSHKVQTGEGYDLTVGKYVKQAYVRVTSDGKKVLGVTICGAYDSQRVYSGAASSKKNTIMSTSLESISDCSTCVQRTYYGWIYF